MFVNHLLSVMKAVRRQPRAAFVIRIATLI